MAQLNVHGATLEAIWAAPPTDKPTLVLLHEGLGSAAMWRDFPAALAEQTGCGAVSVSRRGYGGSSPLPGPWPPSFLHDEAALLPATIEALRLARPPIVFGHSDGASIALIAAAAGLPARALILEAPHVFVEDLTVSSIAKLPAAFDGGLRARLAKWHGANTDALLQAWVEVWLSPAFRPWNIEALLPRLQVPTLVIQGLQDEYGTSAQVEAIARAAAGRVRLQMIGQCGHSPHRDQRDIVLASVAGFVAGLTE